MDQEGLDELISSLRAQGVLRSPKIEEALRAVDRRHFTLPEYAPLAYADTALSIGYGQTISQPYTVVFMLELLDVRSGDRVLEIGYGSGWQSGLLAYLSGPEGRVYAMEIVPELCVFGEENLSKYPDLKKRVRLYCRDASPGLPDIAHEAGGFDRIVAAAAVERVPDAWREQLKPGGIIVYPKENAIWRERKRDGEFMREEFPGFAFVPFVTKKGEGGDGIQKQKT